MSIPLTVLAVIDGFGFQEDPRGNAIAQAATPTLDYLWSNFPHFLVKAAEEEVGLSWGEVGNSEVGHMAIGTGRVIPQSLARINQSLDDGSFYQIKAFQDAISYVKTHNSALHLMGIISTPGIHGHLRLMLALIQLAASHHLKSVYLHLLLDGRDSGPRDTPLYLKDIEATISQTQTGRIATIGGRAFGMDRNNNWEKIEVHYKALMGVSKYFFPTVQAGLDYFYGQNIDDEFILPSLIVPEGQQPVKLQPHDALIFTNYREDRARQMTQALSLPGPNDHPPDSPPPEHTFTGFVRENHPELLVVTMTEYEKGLPVQVAFASPDVPNCLSDVLSQHSIPQIHIAESEKYAHVTYFFNGGREGKRPGEEYLMIPSIKPEEFESKPQMSAEGIAQAVVDSINVGWPFIILNFANPDMIGHTGNLESAVIGIQTVDTCFKKIWDAVSAKSGYLIITADHGNAETMIDPATNKVLKEHTSSPVPLIIAHPKLYQAAQKPEKVMHNASVTGLLSDIAPTILSILNLPIPDEMTGTSLMPSSSTQSTPVR